MNKQCKSCGIEVPEQARFCQNCGSSDFVTIDNEQTAVLNENENPYKATSSQANQNLYDQQNTYGQPTWQPPVPQNQPKKKKTGMIIGIVAAVLIVLAAIGAIAEKTFQNQGYGDNSASSSNGGYNFNIGGTNNSSNDGESHSESTKTEYTKGTFDGSVYVNEWADIQLTLPSGFSNADSTLYESSENSTTDCGAYFISDDTMSLIYICYEKLPSYPKYDEKGYLDSAMQALDSSPSGITYQTTNNYTSTTIGGYSFLSAECRFDNGRGEFAQNIYVRKIDNYIVFVSAIGPTSEYCDILAKMVTKVN